MPTEPMLLAIPTTIAFGVLIALGAMGHRKQRRQKQKDDDLGSSSFR